MTEGVLPKKMTPRERYLTTMAHRRPDRIPAVYAARPEVDRAMMEYYGVETLSEVHDILGTGGRAGVGLAIEHEGWDEKPKHSKDGDWPGAGRDYYWHDERTFENEWGVVQRIGADEKYVRWVSGPLVDADNPHEYPFPTVDDLREPPDLAETVQRYKDQGLFVTSGMTQPYKLCWQMRGMQQFLMDYLVNPDFVNALYDKIYGLWTEIGRRVVRAGVDMFSIGGDIAMQDRIIMGADTCRRYDKPRLAAMFSELKSINPDLHIFLHSDGDLTEIMDDLIEVGFDVIDPIQPECMDPVEVKRRWGDKITLHGCGSLQEVLPFGSVQDVKDHVIELIEKCGYNGGLVLRVSNAIGFDVPVENVVTFFETARDYRFD
ncbi:MAG: uroporphyrinogen decarboxylase family protein [Armatimonadota bacterium]